jgi:oligoribonuclease|tara:strand:- start:6773 stop:7324 length:552 start_codon:yes stop_codon:yes gene_type:complete
MAKESRICLLDLEMSGLDPETERIIEVACFIVEGDLSPIEGAELCLAVKPDDLAVLGSMDSWNSKTHTESGLVRRIHEEGVSIAEAEERVLALLNGHMKPGAIIAGNSVHHDMRFIRREMPLLSDFLTFRIIDVSSFKELFRRISPDGPRFFKRSDHTALADARGSLEELRFYIENYTEIDLD